MQQLVPVVQGPIRSHHHQAVAIPIQGNAQVGPLVLHRLAQGSRGSGAHSGIDVETVGFGTYGPDLGPQLMEYIRRHVVGGPMGAIHHQLQPPQVELIGKGALAELDVAPPGIADAPGPPQPGRLDTTHGAVNTGLDGLLHPVRQLAAAGREELDAIIVIGIVGSGNHHPGLEP